MKIEPFGERLIVKRLSEKERSGIVIPKGTSMDKGLIGQVVHCGPDADWVKEGDMILFAKYSGSELNVDGKYLTGEYEDCLCMNEENILAKLTEATNG